MTQDLSKPIERLAEKSSAVQSLLRFYQAEARYSSSGDAADRRAMLAALHPDIELHQPGSLPYGGIWKGREAFGQWLDAFVATWANVTPMDAVLHECGEEMLVATVTMRATARSTGIQVDMPMCQVIRFSDDLPVEWRNFAWDTVKLIDTLRSAAKDDLAS